MISCAFVLAGVGILFEFLPHEVLRLFEIPASGVTPIFIQLLGAAYLGFAMMNWMAKTVLIGGIYARPLAMANFVHFLIGALGLVKFVLGSQVSGLIRLLTVLYLLFAILFGLILFTHPLSSKKTATK